jgi:hypothetical protein
MNWHRLFGLLLTDFFTDSPFVVELEKDLSHRQQFLDIIILRRRKGRFPGRLPDGLDNLAGHNLLTFKSHQEALDDWALKELTGHYVNYRKQLGPAGEPLLPETDFRLYAVCSRYPHNLANEVPWERLQAGVYQCRRGTDVIRVVVAGQLPRAAHNAMLHLFSASTEQVGYGARHYRQHTAETSTLLHQLFQGYQREGLAMPYTMADFRRDYILEHFKDLTPEERHNAFKGLPPDERRKVIEGLPADERRQAFEGLPPDERRKVIEGLPAEEIEKLLQKLQADRSPRLRRPRGRGRG